MIRIQGLVKRYGRRTAVDGLTLSVPAGTCCALLGPNGAGKTTTVKVLTGLVHPDAGEVVVAGHNLATAAEGARGAIGYVPDQPYLYEKLTGREFLDFVGRMYGMSPADLAREAAALTDRFELGPFLDDLAESYSHGMRQRVVFASALLHRPPVIIVDEPMVGLDPKSIRLVKDILKERSREGAAVLMSTHILDVVEAVADRVGILTCGRLIAEGTPAEVRARAGGATLEEAFLALTGEGPQRRRADFAS